MSEWQSPKVELPPQGVKFLWFKNGDCYVAQRFGSKYLIFSPKAADLNEEPLLWKAIEFPPPYTGAMRFGLKDNDQLVSADEFEKLDPQGFAEFVSLVNTPSAKAEGFSLCRLSP